MHTSSSAGSIEGDRLLGASGGPKWFILGHLDRLLFGDFLQRSEQPLSVLGLAMLALSFVLGPLREVSMGVRLSVGLLVGLSFKYLQDLFGPMSLVYDVYPVVAVGTPILACWAIGWIGLKKVA